LQVSGLADLHVRTASLTVPVETRRLKSALLAKDEREPPKDTAGAKFLALEATIPRAARKVICPTSALAKILSIRMTKNISVFQKNDFVYSSGVPPRCEGRIAIVTKRGAGCGGRKGAD